jgi:hypothetical protein
MAPAAKVLRYGAFTLMTLFGLLGGLFVAGYAFDDPGGWPAVAMTALWVVPLVALSVFAVRSPAAAGPVFVGATAVAVLFTLADSALGIIPRDDWGPVAAIAVFAIAVALAFLGLHRAVLAGLLLVAIGLAQLAATVMGVAIHVSGDGEGPGPGAMLGGSSGVVILPILLVGLLFLFAGSLDHESGRSGSVHAS